MSVKIKVFYHVAELPGWNNLMSEQLTSLSEHGLIDAAAEIHVCVNGDISNFQPAVDVTKSFDNIQWHQVHDNADLGEYPTLMFLKQHCDQNTEEFHVCYIHMKGLSRPNDRNSKDWRHYLEYWSIEQWEQNTKLLSGDVDAVGTNWFDTYEPVVDPKGQKVNMFPHFSANFWWARASYIRKLDAIPNPATVVMGELSPLQKIPYDKNMLRYDNEAWIGSGNPRVHCIHRSPGSTQYPGWHFDNSYPREMYAPSTVVLKPGTSFKPAPYHDLKMPRILVDRRKALGDVLMITPVLKELRRRYGEPSWIQVVTEEPHALHNNPHVNAVVRPAEMKKEDPWDVYINLNDAYETSPLVNYIDAYLRKSFGRLESVVKDIDKTIQIFPTTEETEKVDKIVKQDINSDYIVVHMRRWAWENKNIDVNTWGSFFTLLNHYYPDVKVVTVGAQYDYRANNVHNGHDLVGQLSIGEIAVLIQNAKCFIGGDSGPYHIAAATETPIVALLSHLNPEQILPWRHGVFGKDVTVVQSKVPCVGCYARQLNVPVRNLDCENQEQWACSKNFSFKEIFAAVEQYIK